MFYAKSSIGEEVPITTGGVFARCPKCGIEHQVDLVGLIAENAADGDILDSSVYCEKCSKAHLPIFERSEELEAIAARFPGTDLNTVQNIVRSGLDRGLSFEACLVGGRLALSMKTGKEELFSLTDVAAVLGCSKEEAKSEMERLGIQGASISALPGFEWVLGGGNAAE